MRRPEAEGRHAEVGEQFEQQLLRWAVAELRAFVDGRRGADLSRVGGTVWPGVARGETVPCPGL